MAKSEIDALKERIVELEREIISQTRKKGDIANQALDYSKRTINYFLIVLTLFSIFFSIVGWRTFNDIEKTAENKVDEVIREKEVRWENRFNELERDLVSNVSPSSYDLYARMIYWNSDEYFKDDKIRDRDFSKVIEVADLILKRYPNDDLAVYFKAFSYARLGNTNQAIDNLRKATEMNEYWKDQAKTDKDMESLCNMTEFKKLVEGECELPPEE